MFYRTAVFLTYNTLRYWNSHFMFFCYVENNGLRGTIPREIQHFPILHQLSFEDNPLLSGVVPKELGRLPNLVGLNFQNTSVTGSIDILCQYNYDLVCSLEQEDSMCGFMADLENVDCSCCN